MAYRYSASSSLVWRLNERAGVLRYNVREWLGGRPPIVIQPYRGYGTSSSVHLHGRVLEAQGIRAAGADDSRLANLRSMAKRFLTTEIPYARVRARYHGCERVVEANSEGYFEVSIECGEAATPWMPWEEVALELLAPLRPGYPTVTATGKAFVPPPTARFGVISDVDDTVITSRATNKLRLLATVMLSNARTRLPLSGVAAFYRALLHGPDGDGLNPLFYVSSSPWNLYDMLTEFFRLHDIPYGPVLFLRDWGIMPDARPSRRRAHKLATIASVLGTYRDLPFILIGDSGEQDPEIYLEAVREHQGRISAVYLRHVGRRPERVESIRALAEEAERAGSTLLLAGDTLAFARHAAGCGWIAPGALEAIEAEQQAQSHLPDPGIPLIAGRIVGQR